MNALGLDVSCHTTIFYPVRLCCFGITYHSYDIIYLSIFSFLQNNFAQLTAVFKWFLKLKLFVG